MAWTSPDSFVTKLFSGDPWIILLALVVALSLPILLHLYYYTTSGRVATTPTFLLLGPSGSGKTSLLSILQRRSADPESDPADTRTSQSTSDVKISLPSSIPLGSNKYRSKNDTSLQDVDKYKTVYRMIDTPGHGKLRLEQGLSHLSDSTMRGVIFVVDSSILDASDASILRDTASYLHDVLLTLQRRITGKGTNKAKSEISVLIAANKQDLFTSLPAGAVKDRLQTEIERVRSSRSKGLSSVGQETSDDEDEVLGGGGEEKFTFRLMEEEYRVSVEVVGGAVKGEEAGKGVQKWEEWIGSLL